MSENPVVPHRPTFGHGSVRFEPPASEHDFQPPLVQVGPNLHCQRCIRCGELAVNAPQTCKGEPS